MNIFRWLVKKSYRGKIPGAGTVQRGVPLPAASPASAPSGISPLLSDNLEKLKLIFDRCSDIVVEPWRYGPGMKHSVFSIYVETLIQKKEHNYFKQSLQDLVTHEVGPGTDVTPDDVKYYFERNVGSSQSAILIDDINDAVNKVLQGHIVIFFDGWDKALGYEATGLETRQVSESTLEPVVQGPREATVENMKKNMGMLRERLRNPSFKIETVQTSGVTRTKFAYGYLDGIVNAEMLKEFRKRIDKLKNEEVLETSYVEELIEDSAYSPFPQFRYTERTDVAVAALVEGKIIVLVEGTGSILICPGLLVDLLQSNEDYYQRTVISSLIRLIRLVALFIAIGLPSIYIAFSTFHSELLPTVLLLAIINSREGIPFPAVIEAFIMEFFFELLREAGIRLPRPVGSAVSIVGALVIGEAAINAGIASPIMVIIVSLTGIASFAIPQYNFAIALRILRFPLMAFAAFLGIFGIMVAFLLIWLHLSSLRVLGQPYLSPLGPFIPRQMRDVFIRAPLGFLMRSPKTQHRSEPDS
ncbi:spore germination protein [Cohnella sp. CFH 77786]|uniref:spore germination protein n=1 Tax=Cohnella sp. CFH 77786 TaxID=2662265 RepID=UPI00351D86BD